MASKRLQHSSTGASTSTGTAIMGENFSPTAGDATAKTAAIQSKFSTIPLQSKLQVLRRHLPRVARPKLMRLRFSTKTAPFPFLKLPSELRNHIYGFIVATTYSSQLDVGWDSSYIGMTQVCRQLRAELRPLYWNSEHMHITSYHMENFIAAFFATAPVPQAVAKITVSFSERTIRSRTSWSVLPLLHATARKRSVQWVFDESELPKHYSDMYGGPIISTDVPCSFNRVMENCPPSLLADVAASIFLDISLHRRDMEYMVCTWEFRICISAHKGKLDTEMRRRLFSYCAFLVGKPSPERVFREVKVFPECHIEVRSRGGQVGEKYVWKASATGKPRMEVAPGSRSGKGRKR